jgi:hypothetical protein
LQKVIYIIVLLIFITGCSVIRKGERKAHEYTKEDLRDNIYQNVNALNISNNNFFIQKADIEISSVEGKQNIIGSIKYLKSGTYLISIKNRAGIEAVRIFLSKDTLLVNDRVYRRLYYGSPKWISRKYGIPYEILPVMLGDYIFDKMADSKTEKCINGSVTIDFVKETKWLKYVIDCKLNKVVFAYFQSIENEREAELKYTKFYKWGEILAPGRIQIRNIEKGIDIVIRIKKIQSPWNGTIDFVPGNKYDLIKLL